VGLALQQLGDGARVDGRRAGIGRRALRVGRLGRLERAEPGLEDVDPRIGGGRRKAATARSARCGAMSAAATWPLI
jgi:hypothetical protein